jgi:hypothetical protein
MDVAALTVDPFTGLPVVLLSDSSGRSNVPISIGLGEASAIATELDNIELERPMTHQLMCEMLRKANITVEAVEVNDLVDGTFYARVHLVMPDGERISQEARPSDAFALALRAGAEVHVAVSVVERAGAVDFNPGWTEASAPGRMELDLHDAGDDVFGKWKM